MPLSAGPIKGYWAGTMQYLVYDLPRTLLLGTGVKIALAAAHFHSVGVALAEPWNTWVKNSGKNEGRDVISPGPRLFLPQYWVPALS